MISTRQANQHLASFRWRKRRPAAHRVFERYRSRSDNRHCAMEPPRLGAGAKPEHGRAGIRSRGNRHFREQCVGSRPDRDHHPLPGRYLPLERQQLEMIAMARPPLTTMAAAAVEAVAFTRKAGHCGASSDAGGPGGCRLFTRTAQCSMLRGYTCRWMPHVARSPATGQARPTRPPVEPRIALHDASWRVDRAAGRS